MAAGALLAVRGKRPPYGGSGCVRIDRAAIVRYDPFGFPPNARWLGLLPTLHPSGPAAGIYSLTHPTPPILNVQGLPPVI